MFYFVFSMMEMFLRTTKKKQSLKNQLNKVYEIKMYCKNTWNFKSYSF